MTWRGRHEPDDGDYCIAEVPDDGPAHLVEVLGADDRPAWDDHAVASTYRLRSRFPDEVLAEAARCHEPGPREIAGREDARGLFVLTIDPEDAQDHDDALSVIERPGGLHDVGIHIADVSHYVRPDSALDREARVRGTSTYLPGGVWPMLPPRLSSDLCSLRPERDRLALSVHVTLDGEGRRHAVRFSETVIRSRHRLHYEEVQEILDGGREAPPQLAATLATLRALARALRARRRARGSLDLDVPEVKARVDDHGVPVRVERRAHLESHELVEEFMLLANRCVGAEGARRSAGLIYRIHELPSPRKIDELDAMLKALGLPRPALAADPARALQALLASPLDPPRRRLVHRLVLRTLARARYRERDFGHFGLATREYCHFTSPIRRYPDLHNHARVREWIRGRRTTAWDAAAVAAVADECTASEQNAADAEREAVRVKALRLAEEHVGDRLEGRVTGVTPRGLFVELDEIPVEGFVRLSLYLDDHFTVDPAGVRLVGRRTRRRFSLGDPLCVIVARVDVPARTCDLAIETPPPRRGRRHDRRM